ncbi:MAG: hypothetical protein RL477_2278 [Pseudomonadota bacterium]|jgi:FtsP/CotA-like multicopper oxidase with cupredoxin domain
MKPDISFCRPTRRGFLAATAAGLLAPLLPLAASRAAERSYTLRAAPARARLLGASNPETPVWAYNASVPGPVIRARQGETLRVRVENALAEETTVHWHGLRVPNAMDGVPELTQKAIAPGSSFDYVFDLKDAGTYWYHPHANGAEQIGRGLYGALIVEEREAPRVDRDLLWVIDDWRLGRDASISPDFGAFMDMSHGGRLGNVVTINGRPAEDLAVRAGERLRLRLVNVANARIFALRFNGHRPIVISHDGQPVAPHEAPAGRVVLGPGQRADVILDMTRKPGESFTVRDDYYARFAYDLLNIAYGPEPLRASPLPPPDRLAANPVAEPDLSSARRQRIVFQGGMMGRMGAGLVDGRSTSMGDMMRRGLGWAVNGVVGTGHRLPAVLTLKRNESCVLDLVNDTAWPHPIHLHGHFFRVLARNGRPTPHREWVDTVLLDAQERAEVAFVADNPGGWMLHCHILEHQAGGMQAVIDVGA